MKYITIHKLKFYLQRSPGEIINQPDSKLYLVFGGEKAIIFFGTYNILYE